jgi:hypothetical protein
VLAIVTFNRTTDSQRGTTTSERFVACNITLTPCFSQREAAPDYYDVFAQELLLKAGIVMIKTTSF